MHIVVLDGYTLNPGDNPWTGIEQMGSLEVYDRTPANLIVERARHADVILTNKTPLTSDTLSQLPKLKYISVLATGYNIVDVVAAATHGIPVSNVPSYGTRSVAQHTFALILELCHHVGQHDQSVRDGDWTRSADFCYWKSPLVQLDGLTLGIIGAGRIGQMVGRVGEAFGMNVWMSRRHSGVGMSGWSEKSVDEIFREADVISLHCPQTKENTGFINRALLSTMKASAFLVNTARGGLIVEKDLADALNQSVLAGAALDVVSTEPIHEDNPLLKAKNCLITPHIAWSSLAARKRLMDVTIENIRGFIENRISNRVN